MTYLWGFLLLLLQLHTVAAQIVPYLIPDFVPQPPLPPPAYMVDNTGNTHGSAPDHSAVNGPAVDIEFVAEVGNTTLLEKRASPSFWVGGVAHGRSPYVTTTGYKIYRNVKDYGAKGDGTTDDTKAINDAIVDGNRCGQKCGSTSTLGALIYFPPGTYMVSTPIIQYYYTQFIGDANTWPTIKALSNFQGIAVIDTDVYIPGGNGQEWYISQNQFYRSIRNFNIDITGIPDSNTVNGQVYVPTCLHWQVSQSTSLQNIHFIMIQNSDKQVGIFMESGSGGFLSDLTFYGGQIGFRSGSQQFTMRGLTFYNVATAISMIWNWGMVWKEITIYNAYVSYDIQSFGGADGQGTGSLIIQDNYWSRVPYGITLKKGSVSSALVIDNLKTANCGNIVMNSGYPDPILAANSTGTFNVTSWALGYQYTSMASRHPAVTYGNVTPSPVKPAALLKSDGTYFTRSRPQYETLTTNQIINVLSNGVLNDGTGDQTKAINSVLSSNIGSLIFFPAGVYAVKGTILVPVGSKITGELWPQIMATGPYFQNETSPKVMLQVGNIGDAGIMEISGMLFTVQGPTAGAILVQWNVKQSVQGSAGMWDSHFRIGGSARTNLSLADCPATATNVKPKCKAASMLFHVTKQSSGYFENIWAWTADHDLDAPSNSTSTTMATQISVYSARGILVQSQGPTWFYGTASEHHQLYQYQVSGAKNVYLGHMQTETPYYQPKPKALAPFSPSSTFSNDPIFEDCSQSANSSCAEAWALRVLNSTNVFIYGAGLYSFFSNYKQDCLSSETCQQRLVDIGYSQGLWIYNLFTKGATEALSPQGGVASILSNDTQLGFTTEIAVYLAFALAGMNIGGRNVSNPHTASTTVGHASSTVLTTVGRSSVSNTAGSPSLSTTAGHPSLSTTASQPSLSTTASHPSLSTTARKS